MKVSENGKDLIKKFEGLRLKKYMDSGDGWTIGWGHLIKSKETLPDTITREEAEALLEEDLRPIESVLDTLSKIGTKLSQNEFDALASFAYNIGLGKFKRSSLYRLLLAGKKDFAAKEFSRWIYDDGIPSEGLKKRREAETKLFLKEVV